MPPKRKRNDEDSDDEFQLDSSGEESSSDSEDEPEPKRRRLDSSDSEDLDEAMEQDDELAAAEAAGTLADTAGRGRNVIPNPAFIDAMQYLVEPTYEQFTDHAGQPNGRGGRRSIAVLGPGAFINRNSNADSAKSLPVLVPIRLKYAARDFKAGHLLNAMFGGSGQQRNITALTSNANVEQNTFDNRIKAAIDGVKKVYEGLNRLAVDVTALGYGIRVTVTVSGATWGAGAPEHFIATGMTCQAAVVGRPNVNTLFAHRYPTGQGHPARAQATLDELGDLVTHVAGLVAQANAAGVIDNT